MLLFSLHHNSSLLFETNIPPCYKYSDSLIFYTCKYNPAAEIYRHTFILSLPIQTDTVPLPKTAPVPGRNIRPYSGLWPQ